MTMNNKTSIVSNLKVGDKIISSDNSKWTIERIIRSRRFKEERFEVQAKNGDKVQNWRLKADDVVRVAK